MPVFGFDGIIKPVQAGRERAAGVVHVIARFVHMLALNPRGHYLASACQVKASRNEARTPPGVTRPLGIRSSVDADAFR
jgi:hypothetical protein